MAPERNLPADHPDQVEQSRTLDDLGHLARNGFSDHASDIAHQAGKRRLRAALEQLGAGSKKNRRRIGLSLVAAAAVVSIAVVSFLRISAPGPLRFEVDPKLAQGDYLQPPLSGPNAAVHFSDGSELELDAGGRARVANTTETGAHLVLERGHAALHVVHRPNTHWSFAAGPYKVLVTGTRFTVDWRADEEQLQVVVTEGSVLVQSSEKQEGIAVRAGQRLIATAKDERFELGPVRSAASPIVGAQQHESDAVEAQQPPFEEAGAQHALDVARAGAVPPQDTDTWTKRVANGDFAGVLAAAQNRGIDGVLTGASLPDLVALGDAARYTRNVRLAEQALSAQRSRFASSSAARAAAFLMGRIAEDQRHDSVNALGWYNTYLGEAPQGAFAAEALGRRLVLLERTAGAAAARDSAQSYLHRFPDGPYARVAQQILSAP